MAAVLVETEETQRRRRARWAWSLYLDPWATACAIAGHAVHVQDDDDPFSRIDLPLGAEVPAPEWQLVACVDCDRRERRPWPGMRDGVDPGMVAELNAACPSCGIGRLWVTIEGTVACATCDRVVPHARWMWARP